MSTFLDEKRRRVEQFAQYLRLMGLRRHKVVHDDCFIIFDEMRPEDAGAPKIKESVAITADCPMAGGWTTTGTGDGPSDDSCLEESSSPARYIQFVFMRDCFYLDFPNNTVFPPEVEQILRCRTGFYWAKNRPDLRWVRGNWKDIVKWNPLQKVYLYRDEESAAEDMAFILFQVWKFPVDWRWYIKAAAFSTDHRFEQGKPLD